MIAMSQPNPSLWARIRGFLGWLVSGGLLVGIILLGSQVVVERQNTRIAAKQTYNMGRIAAFRDSGANLDRKVASFNDAAAENRSLRAYRDAVRDALADHTVKAMAMQDVFGVAETDQYLTQLQALQGAVEATKDRTTPGPIITALSRVIVTRTALAKAGDDRT